MAVLGVLLIVYTGSQYGGRMLTDSEQQLAQSIFSDQVDFSLVRIVFDTPYSLVAPITLGNTIHVNTDWAKIQDTSDLISSIRGRHMLIHELSHVMQYQQDGWKYLIGSMYAQTAALLGKGSRNEAYHWEDRVKDKSLWTDWNPEEQAQAISDFDYYILQQKSIDSEKGKLADTLGCIVPLFNRQFCEK